MSKRKKHVANQGRHTFELPKPATRITPNRCPQLQLKSDSLLCEIRNFSTLRLEGRANILADGFQEQIAGHGSVFSNYGLFSVVETTI